MALNSNNALATLLVPRFCAYNVYHDMTSSSLLDAAVHVQFAEACQHSLAQKKSCLRRATFHIFQQA